MMRSLQRLGVFLAVAAATLGSSGVASAATFTVNTIDDLVVGGCDVTHCSLREAIIDANANGVGHDLIAYDIALPPPNEIVPTTPYPPITSEVTIDGTTEPDYAGAPVVELNGSFLGVGSALLTVGGGNSTVRGLALNRVRSGACILLEGPGDNLVERNRIGTDVSGTSALNPFGVGVRIHTSTGDGNRIRDNLISGNNYGILIRTPSNGRNVITGNVIGLDATGTVRLSSGNAGIELEHDGGANRIGGMTSADRNVVSGHQVGIRVSGSSNNLVQGNYVGTDATGTMDVGNDVGGIAILDSAAGATTFPATNNLVGGTTAAAGNVISGNGDAGGAGIVIDAGGNRVQGNLIGLQANGINPLGNRIGIDIQGPNNTIGGVAGAGNVVSSNEAVGIRLVFEADDTLIEGNTIEWNHGNGIEVQSGVRNGIIGNSIRSNLGLGIDLLPPGPTPNDPIDADTGPNELQNHPVLSVGGGTLASAPNTTYRIEFFSNSACDQSGFGEGETFLSAISVTTDALGTASFSVPSGSNVTATATDPQLNTSEFSACRTGPGPPATLVLEPEVDSNPVGSQHCVTATVWDASGNPVPTLSVRFGVTGAHTLSGQGTTDAAGVAAFCYTGTQAGVDTIRAFADPDGDAMEDAGEPADTAGKTWTAVARGKVVGKGSFQSNVGGANVEVDASPAGGTFRVQAGTRHSFVATTIAGFTRVGNSASFRGSGRWNGVAGYTYEVSFVDNGFPGRNDTIDVVVRNAAGAVVFTSGGPKTLKTGNVTVSE
jgi:CSLREA domain-containing protein